MSVEKIKDLAKAILENNITAAKKQFNEQMQLRQSALVNRARVEVAVKMFGKKDAS